MKMHCLLAAVNQYCGEEFECGMLEVTGSALSLEKSELGHLSLPPNHTQPAIYRAASLLRDTYVLFKCLIVAFLTDKLNTIHCFDFIS